MRNTTRRIFSGVSFGRHKDGAKRATSSDLAMRQVLAVKPSKRLPTIRQWMQISRFLSPLERRLGLAGLFLIVLGAGALSYQYVAKHADRQPRVGGEYTEGLLGYPHYINPLYANASDVDSSLSHLVYSSLMRFDPEEGIVPDLAESYQISVDEKEYTFNLRENLEWQDKNPITSEDVAFTMHAIQNPEYRSPLYSTLSGITVEAVDARTVKFTLREPFAPFLATMTIGILPAHVWQNIPASNAQLTQLNLKPVGSGPYIFEKLTKDNKGNLRSIDFVRNPNYYRGAPYIKRLSFKFFSDTTELTQALRNHNIEGSATIPYEETSKLSNDRALNIVRPSTREYMAALFNLKSTGAVADLKVRQALELATDKQSLINNVHDGQATAISSPLVFGVPGYDSSAAIPNQDLDAASALLDGAGWAMPAEGGARTKGDKTLNVPITVLDTPELRAVAEELRVQWERVGVAVNVIPVSSVSLQNDVLKNRAFDVLVSGELYGVFPDPYPFWHSSQVPYPGLNVSQLVSKTADTQIEIIRTTADQNARVAAFTSFANILTESAPAIFLYQPTYPYAMPDTIKNVKLSAIVSPADRFANVHEWYIKTKAVFKKGSKNIDQTP
ncbi:MAG: peptide ABC transporter substrate-binding protein [Patescibacteria group bacterium]